MKKLYFFSTIPLLSLLFTFCTVSHKNSQMNLDGDYQGLLSCTDCGEGLKTNIRIKGNGFEKYDIYIGKEPGILKSEGKWETVNDSTILFKGRNEDLYFKINENHLVAIGPRLQDTVSSKFTLYKIDYDTEAEGNFDEQEKEGIDLVATGNEPFWSIEIKLGDFLRYNKPDLASPEMIKDFSIERLQDVTIVKPHINHEIKEIRIYKFPCVNDMSGLVTDQFIELHLTDQILKGCGKLLTTKLD